LNTPTNRSHSRANPADWCIHRAYSGVHPAHSPANRLNAATNRSRSRANPADWCIHCAHSSTDSSDAQASRAFSSANPGNSSSHRVDGYKRPLDSRPNQANSLAYPRPAPAHQPSLPDRARESRASRAHWSAHWANWLPYRPDSGKPSGDSETSESARRRHAHKGTSFI
jgi:hypothetical protein